MIVSNATPRSNFLHLKRFDILQNLFEELHISRAVQEEIEDFFATHKDWQQSLKEGFIIVHDVQPHGMFAQFPNALHPGEIEALCLCLEHHAELCLMDDKDGRAFATLNGINVSGTIGILIKAKRKGLIATIKPFMDALRTEHYFWISEKMYQKALQASDEI